MEAQEVLTCTLILLGAGVMFFSILGTRRILTLLRASKYLRIWRALFVLMTFFLGGYLGTIALVLLEETQWVLVSVGLVFFFGALFVLLVVRTGYVTMEYLDSKVVERTAEIARQNEQLVKSQNELAERTQELERAYEQLAEHDRLKSRFFSNISHEVRTPLTLILTPLERMLAEQPSPMSAEVKDKIRFSVGNAHRLLRLVNQLLDFSRIESGGATVSFEQVDIRALVEPIVQAFEPFARSKEVELSLDAQDAQDSLPPIYSDPAKLDKVVSNLLSNACKFTEPGGRVCVRLSRLDGAVSLAVADTGIGLSEEDLPHIFERFHQVDSSASRRYEGSGIGLALSKELTELIGGRLEVESAVGRGTTFIVTLPLGDAHVSDPARVRVDSAPASQAKEAAAALIAESGMNRSDSGGARPNIQRSPSPMADGDAVPTVLVVEDNPDMRALVAEICREEYQVLEAENGRRGLELVREQHPALVISDIMMPEVDGYEMLRRMRTDPSTSSIPVILLTAKVDPERMLEGLESGANDYIAKPFGERELLARARNLVRLQQQERQLRELNATLHQRVVRQSTALERTRVLQRYLSADVAQALLEEERSNKLGLQRRRITVFQIELRGFDELVGKNVEPEDMAVMVNSYLSEMMEVAFTHGATVDKFIQDRVVGFFGAPESEGAEQDALRCAKMALEMWQRAVKTCILWSELLDGVPPMPSMVLVTGYATVGSFGSSRRMEYTALGGPLVEANAVLPAIKPGELVCAHSTWALIKDAIPVKYSGEVPLRMRPRPFKLYLLAEAPEELLAASDRTSSLDTIDDRPGTPSGSTPASGPRGALPVTEGQIGPGTVISERYRVTRLLGAGGMGKVFLARDLKLSINVALKTLRRDLSKDHSQRVRLYREVKLARLISHQNVARIYDLDEWQGLEFLTMEYIEGVTLKQQLDSRGAFPLEEGTRILNELCHGLAAAHAARIIHRDLKPSNVMLQRDGRVVILDFGIAKLSSFHETGTNSKEVSGTPHYMAPEQFAGEAVDNRTDIYSLGVLAYEIFTGKLPFQGETMVSLAYMHTQKPPADPASLREDLPPRLAAVILTCLEKAPKDRFSSVAEILSLLGGRMSAPSYPEITSDITM
jgi:signal transduction histidine kinase/DNA-binding response OmpR family regulator/predicted Ser/Thr protein kinase